MNIMLKISSPKYGGSRGPFPPPQGGRREGAVGRSAYATLAFTPLAIPVSMWERVPDPTAKHVTLG